jgi:hypothetical protein
MSSSSSRNRQSPFYELLKATPRKFVAFVYTIRKVKSAGHKRHLQKLHRALTLASPDPLSFSAGSQIVQMISNSQKAPHKQVLIPLPSRIPQVKPPTTKAVEPATEKRPVPTSGAVTSTVTDLKLRRANEFRSKLEDEKAKRLEEDLRRKDEERRKKEADAARRKRQREEEEKRERDEKRRRLEDALKTRKEVEERQRVELEEKERWADRNFHLLRVLFPEELT